MRIQINLASKPFVELRPLFARLRLAMGALALLAVALLVGSHVLSAKAEQATARMNLLTAQTNRVEMATAANQARMRRPENQAVLARVQFLNALFARKAFSWTAVMMDLEHVLPAGVQVTSIDPVISKEGEVTIRLRVTGPRDRAIQLVRNLEVSQRFVDPRLSGEAALAVDKAKAIGAVPGGFQTVGAGGAGAAGQDATAGVEFEILSGYNPLAAVKRDRGMQDAAPATGEDQP